MAERPVAHPPGDAPPQPGQASADELAELRQLLLGPERRDIAQVKQDIERLGRLDAEDVAPVLPQAVLQSSRTGQQIAEAMLPVVEEDIGLSVKRHPEKLAELLFPVIGPAIRKAVREALNSMIEAINQTVDHSISPRAVQWRLEAMRTGKPFAEVVFVHTMLYRVEQVFLIHRETGLLLQHASAPNAPVKDPDMVSGMLTAIQDFVRDSFNGHEDSGQAGKGKGQAQTRHALAQNGHEGLGSLEIGDLTVWIERGPEASVAGVIRGHAPRDLRAVFQIAVEDIHREQQEQLEDFKGDTAVFVPAKPHLEGCLQFRSNPAEAAAASKRKVKPAHVLGGLLLAALAIGGFFYLRGASRWQHYLDALRQQPGLVVTEARRGWFSPSSIAGLKDPMAVEPQSLMAASGLDPASVTSSWTPYQALDPSFVLARAKNLLAPPETVAITLQQDGVLEASGLAPPQWIADARKLALAVPGITRFKDDRLIDARWAEMGRLRDKVVVYNVLFGEGQATPLPTAQTTLNSLIADIARLASLARAAGRPLSIEVIGHTDGSGAEGLNRLLSQRRAEAVRAVLAAKLPPGVTLTVKGVSNAEPLREERTDEDRAWNRRVAVNVTMGNPEPEDGR
jgi:OOP family OmpA-OmpF porin